MATVTGIIETVHESTSEIARRPLQAEQCSLVVVDIQERLLPPIFEKERLIRNSQLLIRLANILKLPVAGDYAVREGPGTRRASRSLPCCRPRPPLTRWSSAASPATNSAPP